jgi:hypothetical protein
MSLETIFLVFVGALVLVVLLGVARFVPPRRRSLAVAVVIAWTLAATLFAASGALASTTARPPAIVYVFLATAAVVAFSSRSRGGALLATSVPLVALTALRSMRAVVELVLHGLWEDHRLPTALAFQGGNVDILVGITAPIVAFLYATGRLSPRALIAWNVLGLVSLANVVARAVLTSPIVHAIPSDAPSPFGSLPYALIPTLVVPLAVALHVLGLRRIVSPARANAVTTASRLAFDR